MVMTQGLKLVLGQDKTDIGRTDMDRPDYLIEIEPAFFILPGGPRKIIRILIQLVQIMNKSDNQNIVQGTGHINCLLLNDIENAHAQFHDLGNMISQTTIP